MSRFSSCVGCRASPATCDIAKSLKHALKGFDVSYVRRRCPERAPLYEPGDAVRILTRAWLSSSHQQKVLAEPDQEPPICWFRGVFVEQKGSKAVCFIAPETADESGQLEFETDGSGFVKIPLSRVKLLPDIPATDLNRCGECGQFFGLTKTCDGDPNYKDKRKCALLSATAEVAARAEG